MTIPYQHNCSHMLDGWCLDCAFKLGEDHQSLRQAILQIVELAHNPSFAAPDLCGDPNRYEKLVDRIGALAHNALK